LEALNRALNVTGSRYLRHPEGRAGVTTIGLLPNVHRKKSDAVGHIPKVLSRGLGFRLTEVLGASSVMI
jgi:hypothetical protein